MSKYKSSDLFDGICTAEQYYSQFNTANRLEIGGQYVNNKGTWQETEYTIVYVGNDVALGVESVCGEIKSKYHNIGGKPTKELFIATGIMAGWRCNDPRACYRLQEK